MKKIIKNKSGFTIVELLISISIIGMVSVLFYNNYRATSRQNVLAAASHQLAGDFRAVQGYASGAKKNNGSVPKGGWGIYLATTSANYIIFTDDDESKDYNVVSELYRSVDLPVNVHVDKIEVTKWDGTPVVGSSTVSTVFLPPDPKTYITTDYRSDSTDNVLRLWLKDSINQTTRTILVNYFGLIDVQ
ncbi:MAG: hypothetical protein UT48_C0014G0018 [Parcubacteria group bacterium GW2011_GWE2_39_37]|uniref:Prepilin-type N-terminal cleavage/methylation domain-containing protein n=1 Tax=Candidatus Falkowbacteria bacterium GW2011_GWF2_39_8 TaxID=1618642 RepID=A0A0G0T478_9BACT|nr:MAG: hypothetical protein UT48_C0014G0018 [Parcubacteria group bacterium GW2011_GWE2_39_37]KKR32597.1 MAG: hypothetical protein UT64_C0028G0013 [Candidatus Falkowbacteria bacterium GW2011_GWF2_39_8]